MKELTDLVDEILRDDAALCVRRPPPAETLPVPK
jgi:hypothetical protein